MIEFETDLDNGRQAYRHTLSAEDRFMLVVDGTPCDAVNLSENGVAYNAQDGSPDGELPAVMTFMLDGKRVTVECKLVLVRAIERLRCCSFVDIPKVHHLMLSRYIMHCQKESIRRARRAQLAAEMTRDA